MTSGWGDPRFSTQRFVENEGEDLRRLVSINVTQEIIHVEKGFFGNSREILRSFQRTFGKCLEDFKTLAVEEEADTKFFIWRGAGLWETSP